MITITVWAGAATAAVDAVGAGAVAGAGVAAERAGCVVRAGWAELAGPQPARAAATAGISHSAALTAQPLLADGEGRRHISRTARRPQAAHSRHTGWPPRSSASCLQSARRQSCAGCRSPVPSGFLTPFFVMRLACNARRPVVVPESGGEFCHVNRPSTRKVRQQCGACCVVYLLQRRAAGTSAAPAGKLPGNAPAA